MSDTLSDKKAVKKASKKESPTTTESAEESADAKKSAQKSGGKLKLSARAETGQITQSFSRNRTKTVQVEVKRRTAAKPKTTSKTGAKTTAKTTAKAGTKTTATKTATKATAKTEAKATAKTSATATRSGSTSQRVREAQASAATGGLLASEQTARQRAVEQARVREQERAREQAAKIAKVAREKNIVSKEAEVAEAPAPAPEGKADTGRMVRPSVVRTRAEAQAEERAASRSASAREAARAPRPARPATEARTGQGEGQTAKPREETESRPAKSKRKSPKGPGSAKKRDAPRRRQGKLTIAQALEGEDYENRMRSLAAVHRKREREKRDSLERLQGGATKVVREVIVPETIEVQELASRMAERVDDVLVQLQRLGMRVSAEDVIDADTAELVVSEYRHKIRRVTALDVEEGLEGEDDKPEDLVSRPPVVTVMGHVDHGKTSLLDAIRRSDQADKEAGGITQHIGASFVELKGGRKLCFIDTPGHMAFTALRARGANVTDIVILVVSAEDSVMEQTREAYDHAKAAGATMIVAVNKMDRPQADLARVKNDLLALGIVPEDMGGEVQVVPTSAKTGDGVEDLLEAVFLQGELLALKANPKRDGQGVILEASLEQGRGAVATVLVRNGTLKVGQNCIAGRQFGRVRALTDWRGKRVKEATPAMPVEMIGLDDAPEAGDGLLVLETEQRCREIAETRRERYRHQTIAASARSDPEDVEDLLRRMEQQDNATPVLNFVLKSDVRGSAEAVKAGLEKLSGDEVEVRILHNGIGGIKESDILLAKTTGASILGFNVRATPPARALAEKEKIALQYYKTIYELLDDAKAAVEGELAPESREQALGEAEVREVFDITRHGKIAGCQVLEGMIRRNARARVVRNGEILHDGKLRSLRRFKDEAAEVRQGLECGLSLENFQDYAAGDRIECYEVQEIARSL